MHARIRLTSVLAVPVPAPAASASELRIGSPSHSNQPSSALAISVFITCFSCSMPPTARRKRSGSLTSACSSGACRATSWASASVKDWRPSTPSASTRGSSMTSESENRSPAADHVLAQPALRQSSSQSLARSRCANLVRHARRGPNRPQRGALDVRIPESASPRNPCGLYSVRQCRSRRPG